MIRDVAGKTDDLRRLCNKNSGKISSGAGYHRKGWSKYKTNRLYDHRAASEEPAKRKQKNMRKSNSIHHPQERQKNSEFIGGTLSTSSLSEGLQTKNTNWSFINQRTEIAAVYKVNGVTGKHCRRKSSKAKMSERKSVMFPADNKTEATHGSADKLHTACAELKIQR